MHTALYVLVLTHVLVDAHTKKDKLMYMVRLLTGESMQETGQNKLDTPGSLCF